MFEFAENGEKKAIFQFLKNKEIVLQLSVPKKRKLPQQLDELIIYS